MERRSRLKWLGLLLAVGFAALAAFSYYGYVGNGITAGSLIGLPGREGDVATAQHYARWFLAAAVLFQAGVAAGLYFLLEFGTAAKPVMRFAERSIIAVLMSFPFTFVVTAIMEAGMRFIDTAH